MKLSELNLSIRSKIFAAFSLFALLLILVTWVVIQGQITTTSNLDRLNKINHQANLTNELVTDTVILQRDVLIYKETANSTVANKVQELIVGLMKELAQLQELNIDNDARQQQIAEMQTLLENYAKNYATVVENRKLRQKLVNEKLVNVYESIIDDLNLVIISFDSENETQTYEQLIRLKDLLQLSRSGTLQFLRRADSGQIILVKSTLTDALTLAKKIKSEDANANIAVAKIQQQLNDYEETFLTIVQTTRAYLYLINVVMAGNLSEFISFSQNLNKSTDTEFQNVSEQINEEVKETGEAEVGVSILALIIALLLAWRLSEGLVLPIKKLTTVLNQLSAGKTVFAIPGIERKDELGEMAVAADVFRTKNEEVRKLFQQVSDLNKELEQRVEERTRDLNQSKLALQAALEEEHEAFEALNLTDERLNLALEASDVGIWDWDLTTETITFDKQMEKIFGITEGDFSGQLEEVFTLIHPNDQDLVRTAIDKSINNVGVSYNIEYRLVIPDSANRYINAHGEVYRDEEGKPVRMSGTCQDISARKKIELQLKESEERTRAILDNAVDGILTINKHGIVASINPAAEKLFSYAKGEVIGQNIKMLMPEPYHSEHDGYLANYQNTGKRKIIGSGQEVVAQRKDGSTFPIELAVSETQTTEGPVFTGIVRDITDRRLFEQALVDAKQDAEAANLAKSQFLANMSHELRTPLNAIIGYSEMLAEDAADTGESQVIADLKKIESAGQHLLGLINDILDLSKIEAGKMELTPELFSVTTLINDVVTTVQPLINKNQNRLEVACDESVGQMHSDPLKLRQVLFNILSNAAKFTHDGQIDLTVSRTNSTEGQDREVLEFSVRDTGIGMKETELSRLFQPFMQADSSTTRSYEGTGLGLVISRRLCELMGGNITVQSDPGNGSLFTLILPVQIPGFAGQPIPVSVASTELEHAEQANAIRQQQTGRRVLVIDDDAQARGLLRIHLENNDWQVITASGGETGLQLARELQPAAITLDVMMPKMDGWTVLQLLKADPELATIPVIMCTIVDEKKRSFALGATDYLIKPVQRELLLETLQKYTTATAGHVLIVDDEAPARELLNRNMADDGWVVTEAVNGKDCLQQLAKQTPDIILLDLMMPELDGFGVIDELQQHDEWQSIPVIVITAKILTKKERNLLNARVVHIMEKGQYSKRELLAEVVSRLNNVVNQSKCIKN